MSLAIKNHRHEHSFFKELHVLFFFNTLCGEMMMYWYSTELIGASRLRWCTEQRSIYQDEKNKRQVAEQLPGVTTFVLIISLAMRFVVLYTWIKETCPQSSLIVKKWTTYIIWVAFGFMFIGNPEEKSIDPPFQLQQRNSWWDGIIATIFSRTSTGHSFFSSKVAAGQQHHSTASDQETCYCLWMRWASSPLCPPPPLAGSSLAAAGRQTVVQRIAERLGGLEDLRAARGDGFFRTLPEQLQPGLPAHLGDAGSASLPPAAHPRLGRDGQAARVNHPAGGGAAGLHALRGCREVGNVSGHVFHLM